MKKRTFIDPETGEKFILDLDSEFVGIQTSKEAKKAGVITNGRSKLKNKLLSNNNEEYDSLENLLENNGLTILGGNIDDEN